MRARPVRCIALLYAILSLAMVSPGLVPGRTLSSSDYLWTAAPWAHERPAGVRPGGANLELADSVSNFQPAFRFTRSALPDVPLWNPHIMAGRPFLGDAQSAVLSPFSVPAYVLPFWWSLGVIAALKLFVGAFGTFLLGRALGMRNGGALLAGLCFGFSLDMVEWLAWPLPSVWAWLPWMLLLADRLARAPAPLPAAGLAGVVALQFFGGHPESSFHVLFATCAFFLLRLGLARREARRSPRQLAGSVGVFAVALAGGAALAAVAILPFLELLFHSADLTQRSGAKEVGLDTHYFAALALPDYWGRPGQHTLEAFVNQRAFYVGALPLLLAAIALVLRPTLERIAVAAFAGFCLLLVFAKTPLAHFVEDLPGFNTAHNARVIILIVMCLALLAGWAVSDLLDRSPPPRRRGTIALALAAALVLVPLVWVAVRHPETPRSLLRAFGLAWGVDRIGDLEPPSNIHWSALAAWVPLAAAALALLAWRLRGGLAAAPFVTLAVALVTLDLFRAGLGQNPAIARADATQPTTGALRYLQSRRPARFVGLPPPQGIVPITPNAAMDYGLYDARGYDYPVEQRYDRLWRRRVASPDLFAPPATLASAKPAALRALSLLSVADLVAQPGSPPVSGPGLRLAYDGPDARVYANDRALPRAFVADRQHVVAGGNAALAAVTRAGFDARRTVVTEHPIPGLGAAGPTSGPAGTASLAGYRRERVRVRADVTRPGVVVLTDTDFPGWKASVDGHPARLERVDYLLRGVPVGPGRHTVEFRYEPASWRAGWILSGLTLAGLLVAVAVGARAARRRRRDRA